MLSFFTKLCFFATCFTLLALQPSAYEEDEAIYSSDYQPTDYDSTMLVDMPLPPDPTQATPEAEPIAPSPETLPSTDAVVPNTQLKWPDTIELQETATNILPASATTSINAIFDKTQQTITEMDTVVKEMVQKRTGLYGDFFTQSAAVDDFIQEHQTTIGSLIELFNPSVITKE